MGKKTMLRILHLTDLHWGSDAFSKTPEDAWEKRRRTFDESLIPKLNDEYFERVDFVVFTGDVSFSGKEDEYSEALNFFNKIRTALGFDDFKQFIICPGNHDFNRQTAKFQHEKWADGKSPEEIKDSQKIDKENALVQIRQLFDLQIDSEKKLSEKEFKEKLSRFVKLDYLHILKEPFEPFSYFLRDELKVIRPINGFNSKTLGKAKTQKAKMDLDFLYGYVPDFEEKYGVRFQIVNSSWLSFDNHDDGNLFVGETLIEDSAFNKDVLNISLIHHPFEFLAYQEYNIIPYSNKPAYLKLLKKSNLVLSGHIHTSTLRHTFYPEYHTNVIVGGATYVDSSYYNGMNIIDIDLNNNFLSYKPITLASHSIGYEWRGFDNSSKGPFALGNNNDEDQNLNVKKKEFWHKESIAEMDFKEYPEEEQLKLVDTFIIKTFLTSNDVTFDTLLLKKHPHFSFHFYGIEEGERTLVVPVPFEHYYDEEYFTELSGNHKKIVIENFIASACKDDTYEKIVLLPYLAYNKNSSENKIVIRETLEKTIRLYNEENSKILVNSLIYITFSELKKQKFLPMARKCIDLDNLNFYD